MSTQHLTSPPPDLTPSLCFNTTFLRDFLRTSRAQLDDTISTNLNSLVTPSTRPFDPTNTLSRQTRQPLPLATARAFINDTVLPTWSARQRVLSYCSIVAASPDPDDPDKTLIEAQNMAASHRVIDERLDPYSGRFFPREPRTEVLAGVLRNENAVESIVRERTWRILGERCGASMGQWQDAFTEWEQKR